MLIKNEPLVSVIVPSYNHETYITQCIESIVNQTYSNFELIVVDDGSTDKSIEILSSLKSKYGFSLICQKNKGLSATLTDVIKNIAKGEYISMCASDDLWVDSKIQTQVAFMAKDFELQMCYSKCYYIDKNSVVIKNKKFYREEKLYRSGYLFEDLFLLKYHPPVSYMFTRKILEELNFFTRDIYCEDFYMNLKISENHKIGFIDKYLMYYRFEVNTKEKEKKIIDSQKKIIDHYKDNGLYNKSVMQWKLRSLVILSSYPEFREEYLKLLFDIKFSFDFKFWKSMLIVIRKTLI